LDYFGGAPAQVRTPAAHRQAAEIGHTLYEVSKASEHCPRVIRARIAMAGLAYAVACEHERGREIRSLAFIAEALARKTWNGDDTWAYDVPLGTHADSAAAYALAVEAADALENFTYGIRIDRREVLSTYTVEHRGLIERHTRQGVVAKSTRHGQPAAPADGGVRCSGLRWILRQQRLPGLAARRNLLRRPRSR
jgi:hypothetical protein